MKPIIELSKTGGKHMKYLASDFDGTLYFGKEGIHEEDKQAVVRFQEAGNKFGICSGRPFIGMMQYLGDLKADFYIQNSGAHILDKDGNTLFEKTIDRETIQVICENNPGYTTIFYGQKHIYINVNMNHPFFKSIDDLLHNEEEKIYGFSVQFKDEESTHPFVKEVGRMEALDVYQNKNSLDCVAKGCSKESGIEFMKQYYQCEEMACIGDSYNDVPMLENSASSFTFHSSPIEVQKKAAYVVSSIHECIDQLMNM